MTSSRRAGRLVLAAGAAALLTGCGAGPAAPADAGSARTLTVFAAASLQHVFTDLGTLFEQQHPGTTVRFAFAGSSDLVAQLTQGAPGDVFASADRQTMAAAAEAGIVRGEPADFATNSLTIVTPPGNPAGVTSFADLAKPGTAVVVCAEPVPCGAATRKVEDAAGIRLDPVSEEQSVADVLNKVTSGEADAGLVYLTDARAAGDRVTEVDLPQASAAVNTYPIAALQDAADPDLAQAYVELVTGAQGRQVLAAAGFGPPP